MKEEWEDGQKKESLSDCHEKVKWLTEALYLGKICETLWKLDFTFDIWISLDRLCLCRWLLSTSDTNLSSLKIEANQTSKDCE